MQNNPHRKGLLQFIHEILQFSNSFFQKRSNWGRFTPTNKTTAMQRFTLIFICLLFSFTGMAQTTITGSIASTKGETLPGANVYIKDTYDGASSDLDGNFILTTTETGAQVLMVEFIGFEADSIKMNLTGAPLEFNFKIKEKFNQLKAVEITAGEMKAGETSKMAVLTNIDMVTTAGAQGDVIGALQTLPGTTTVGESGRLFVRGGTSRETQTYIDGNLVFNPYTSTTGNVSARGRYNPFMFKGNAFSTGAYSAEYGQALSSVLVMSTNDMQAEDRLDIGILPFGADISGTKKGKKQAITASANYFNFAPYMQVVPQNMEWIDYPESFGGAINYRRQTGESGMLKLYSTANTNSLALNSPDVNNNLELTPTTLNNAHTYHNLSWETSPGNKWRLKHGAVYSYNRDRYGLNNSTYTESLTGVHLKSVGTYYATEKVRVKTGAEMIRTDYDEAYEENTNNFTNGFLQYRGAAFAETQVYLNNSLVFNAGLRGEYTDRGERMRISPRASMAWLAAPNHNISLAYGQFHQAPSNSSALYYPTLRDEQSEHYIASWQWSAKKRIVRAEAYYKDYSRLVKNGTQDNDLFPSTNNQGTGYAYGFDFFYRDSKTIKNGQYWISYSYLQTERDFSNYPELAVPSFASKHNLTFVYKHWIGKWRSLVGATYSYSSPRVYNNPNSSTFNGETMPAYQSLNVSWSYLHRENVIFFASVSNILGYQNEFGKEYANTPNANGVFPSREIQPAADRFIVFGLFVTLSKKDGLNQLDQID